MDNREALLRAIVANPDDDTPRLMYADWLQENGNEDRAAVIRLEIALARDGFASEKERRKASTEHIVLRKRPHVIQQLYSDMGYIVSTLPEVLAGTITRYPSHRGFEVPCIRLSSGGLSDRITLETDANGVIQNEEVRNAIASLSGFFSLQIEQKDFSRITMPDGCKANLSFTRLQNLNQEPCLSDDYSGNLTFSLLRNLNVFTPQILGRNGDLAISYISTQMLAFPSTKTTGDIRLITNYGLQILNLPPNWQKGDLGLHTIPYINSLDLPDRNTTLSLTVNNLEMLGSINGPAGGIKKLDISNADSLQSINFGNTQIIIRNGEVVNTGANIKKQVLGFARAGNLDNLEGFIYYNHDDAVTVNITSAELREAREAGIKERAARGRSGAGAGGGLPENPKKWEGRMGEQEYLPAKPTGKGWSGKAKKPDFGPREV